MTKYFTHWQHYRVTEMSFAKHHACFTTKLQGQNLATFSHSAVTPVSYLQHTVNTNKTCINNALIMHLKN